MGDFTTEQFRFCGTTPALKAFHADLLTSGRRRGRVDVPLSASVHNVLRVVHWTLADVVRWGLPTRNVADFAGICCGVRGHRKSSRTPDVPSGHPVALDRLSRHFRCTTAIGLRIFALPDVAEVVEIAKSFTEDDAETVEPTTLRARIVQPLVPASIST